MPDRSGFVDSLLFGLVVSAQLDAERAYVTALVSGPYPDRLDGIAEGLAHAVALLGGDQPAVVRATASKVLEDERRVDADQRARASDALARLRAIRSSETLTTP